MVFSQGFGCGGLALPGDWEGRGEDTEEEGVLLRGGLAKVDQEFLRVCVCFQWGFLFQRDSQCSSPGWCLKGETEEG